VDHNYKKLKYRKQDPYERIMLWLHDLEINKVYPVAVPKNAKLLGVDDEIEQGVECKTPILPPIKDLTCRQSQGDNTAPCHKQSQGDVKDMTNST